MAEGKDLMRIALPFLSGTVTGNIIVKFSEISESLLHIAAGALPTAIFAIAFTYLKRHTKDALRCDYKFMIIWLSLLCGIFCSISHSLIKDSNDNSFIEFKMKATQNTLCEIIDNIPYQNNETAGLAKALICGNRSSLSKEIRDSFRKSGASHLLALSGMHLGIIYLIISKLLTLAGKNRTGMTIKSILIISGAAFYCGMTGWSPSITRAFLFIALRETASVTGRHYSLTSSLATALIIQCAINPNIVSSVSFQMSYLAMTGIAFIFPKLQSWFPNHSEKSKNIATTVLEKLWDCAALSISCQLTTGPLAYLRFRTTPFYFLITNLIAIPLTTLAIPTTILAVAGSATGCCTIVTARISEFILESLIYSLKTIALLPSL